MLFAKDDRKNPLASSITGAAPATASTSKTIPKQYAFGNEDDMGVEKSFGGITRGGPTLSAPSAAALLAHGNSAGAKSPDKKLKQQRRPSPPQPALIPHRRFMEQSLLAQPPKAPAGQVVLDKFGNFRLASTDKPPEPPAPPRGRGAAGGGSRSRSRSRRRYSSGSRSRSRSMKRRSRSRSYGRRRGSRSRSFRSRTGSRSRSYSRSRSRSGSVDRRRDRRTRGNRGGYDRGTYYKPRFGNSRGQRGGGRGGFRDYRDFRNNRGRDRYRGGWGNNRGGGGNGSRYRNYRDDSRERRFDRRSRSRSFNSGDERKRSPNEDRKFSDNEPDRNNSKRDARRSPPPPSSGGENWNDLDEAANNIAKPINAVPNVASNDASLEEIEKIIDKAKKENKEDMIERNKDLVKKTTTW